ncbi:MAG TPA: GGDEF-domain containing protein [Erythrobacter sp.]|nr:GGDEF-domain containing protein [Erythrobacter sp.]
MSMTQNENPAEMSKAERDFVALGIATASIILFVGTGGRVVPEAINSLLGEGLGPDKLLANALLLNIALIIFGWRRYRELTTEIAERRKAEANARRLAEIDPLTECLNRRSMSARTEEFCQKAREQGRTLAFVMIDLDDFKKVNDRNGHAFGDKVLINTAQRLRDCLPKGTPIARLGGDEFAYVTSFDPTRRELVDDQITKIFDAVGAEFEASGVVSKGTISIGIATCWDIENSETDVENLMHRADMAMYQAKKQGKDRYSWFTRSMADEQLLRQELESNIRAGIAAGEFIPYYEQQIDLKTNKLLGFEMLARWQSPELGLVLPESFIPVAEEIGVIAELSESLMIKAFVDARDWDPSLTLSVNISPVQLRDPWFAEKILKLLVEHNFPPHRLEIEITESCLIENVDLVRRMTENLHNQGVKVSLDDFGAGYSSLEQLRSLPFDTLKIHRSFISDVRDAQASTKIVDAIVSLGAGLKMPVTAEGIEDEKILEKLKVMGDLKGQGYLYGQPENAEQVRERLAHAGQLAAGQEVTESSDPSDTELPRSKSA